MRRQRRIGKHTHQNKISEPEKSHKTVDKRGKVNTLGEAFEIPEISIIQDENMEVHKNQFTQRE